MGGRFTDGKKMTLIGNNAQNKVNIFVQVQLLFFNTSNDTDLFITKFQSYFL